MQSPREIRKPSRAGSPGTATPKDPAVPQRGSHRMATAALIGMVAAVVPPPHNTTLIPHGFICTACKQPNEHSDKCRQPRGLMKAEA